MITGAASGIGEALALSFVKRKANVLIADKNQEGLSLLAKKIKCFYQPCDVGNEESLVDLVHEARTRFGHIDLFCSNAGVFFSDKTKTGILDNKYWEETLQVNLMSHVYAARHVLPHMVKRQSGYFLQIISAAALLSQIGASAYSASKSAALSFAESIAISHGQLGIKVSAACPQYVATPMLGFHGSKIFNRSENLISANEAAKRIIDGVIKEKFLILTDSKVIKFFNRKCEDYDKWIKGMQRLQTKVIDEEGKINLHEIYKFI